MWHRDAPLWLGVQMSYEDLNAVPAPSTMRATMLQQFDTLAPQLQHVLKTVSPLHTFSQAMLGDVGLPSQACAPAYSPSR